MTVIRETGAVIIVVTNWQIVQDQTSHWIVHIIRPHIGKFTQVSITQLG